MYNYMPHNQYFKTVLTDEELSTQHAIEESQFSETTDNTNHTAATTDNTNHAAAAGDASGEDVAAALGGAFDVDKENASVAGGKRGTPDADAPSPARLLPPKSVRTCEGEGEHAGTPGSSSSHASSVVVITGRGK